jgi:hypothetical protein
MANPPALGQQSLARSFIRPPADLEEVINRLDAVRHAFEIELAPPGNE